MGLADWLELLCWLHHAIDGVDDLLLISLGYEEGDSGLYDLDGGRGDVVGVVAFVGSDCCCVCGLGCADDGCGVVEGCLSGYEADRCGLQSC